MILWKSFNQLPCFLILMPKLPFHVIISCYWVDIFVPPRYFFMKMNLKLKKTKHTNTDAASLQRKPPTTYYCWNIYILYSFLSLVSFMYTVSYKYSEQLSVCVTHFGGRIKYVRCSTPDRCENKWVFPAEFNQPRIWTFLGCCFSF